MYLQSGQIDEAEVPFAVVAADAGVLSSPGHSTLSLWRPRAGTGMRPARVLRGLVKLDDANYAVRSVIHSLVIILLREGCLFVCFLV